MNAMAILEDWLDSNVPRVDEWSRSPPQPRSTITEEWWQPLPADTPDDQLMIPRIADHEVDYSRSAERIRDHPPFTGATEDQTCITQEERDEQPCTVDTTTGLLANVRAGTINATTSCLILVPLWGRARDHPTCARNVLAWSWYGDMFG